MSWSAREVASAVGGQLLQGRPETILTHILHDSRAIGPQGLFVALQGQRDGHEFVPHALEQGAAGALVSRPLDLPERFRDKVLILVGDTLEALTQLAAHHRSQKTDCTFFAITGSYGKTTTKELLAHLLRSLGLHCFVSPGNWNNHIGVPLSLLSLQNQDYGVFELGASGPGEIDALAGLVRPQVGILTAIGPAHLEGFGSIEGVRQAKGELLAHVEKMALLNGDCPHCQKLCSSAPVEHLTFGFASHADFRCQLKEVTPQGTLFSVEGCDFFLPLWGRGNVRNGTAALLALASLGLPWQKASFEGFQSPPLRLQRRELPSGVTLFEDCYNASPASLEEALEVVNSLATGRKVLLFGDMRELGSESERWHRELGAKAAQKMDALFAIGEEARFFYEAFREHRPHSWHFENPQDLLERLSDYLRQGDTLLVKGSRSLALEKLVAQLFPESKSVGKSDT